jgi:catechol 2,3-dioxygenase-like lactoylglutathione lyase family enzyme
MRIHSVTLVSSDLGVQAEFWGRTVGLPVRWDGDVALELPLQGSVIRLESNGEVDDPQYHFAINIPPGSISDAAEWISARHDLLAFRGDPDEEEGATIVRTDRGASTLYFLDPGGNVVELIANQHLDEQYSGTFDAGSLLEVAEIGIATADVARTRAEVQQTFAADVLWGGREGWQLTAVGDDHGVVIVAPAGRGWIPVGLPARPLPTTVIAAGPRRRETTLAEGPYRFRAVTTWP